MKIETTNEFDAAVNNAVKIEVVDDNTAQIMPGAKAQRRYVRNIVVGATVLAAVAAARILISRNPTEDSTTKED